MMADQPEQSQAVSPGARKVAGVIITHGHLAGELLAAAEMIIGSAPNSTAVSVSHLTAVSIGWHDDDEAAHNEIERAIARVSQGIGVLLLTDMFGGTPTNMASKFHVEGEIEVVTGVNLPMVIKLASQSEEETLGEIARRVRDQGQKGIYLAGEFLAPQKRK